MKKKKPIIAKDLPSEMTQLEGLERSIDIANMSELVNAFLWKLANVHSLDEIAKSLRRFRGNPYGFWRRPAPQHHGNK